MAETQYAFVVAHEPHRLLAFKVGGVSELDVPAAGVIVGRSGISEAHRDLEALLRMIEARQAVRRGALGRSVAGGSLPNDLRDVQSAY